MNTTITRVLKGLLLLGISLPIVGCETNTQTGALVGGAAGAGLGAAAFHNSAYGALVGGTLGALTGASIGNAVDRDQAYRNGYYYGPYGPAYYYAPAPPPPGYYYAPPPPRYVSYPPQPRYVSYPAHGPTTAPSNQAVPATAAPTTQPGSGYQDYQR